MTPHLTPEETLLAAYGEAVREHACDECARRGATLRVELAALGEDEVPEPPAGWEAATWARLRPELKPRTARRWPWLAAAAALLLAFLLGREFPRTPDAGPDVVAVVPPPPVRDRILLLAAGDQLERSQMLLVEVMNADPAGSELPREKARELVASSRLVRQAATGAGEDGVADVLDELERVLVEIAHTPREAGATEVAALHRRIQGRSLIFKVRVLGTQLRAESAARPTTSS